MGSLAAFNLDGIRELHRLRAFVETGTATGDGVAQALANGFEIVHSIEVVPAVAAAAQARFGGDKRVTIWTDDSRHALPLICRELPPGPALFWLDAHFPGAHTQGADYAAEPDLGRRLPLRDELQIIAEARPDGGDVLLIDDARLYQPGPYGAGDLPPDWAPLRNVERSLGFVRELFGRTHGVVVDYRDQGYVMIFPHASLKQAA